MYFGGVELVVNLGKESAMKFASPNALWFVLAIPVLIALWVLSGKRAQGLLRRLVAARLEKLLVGESSGRLVRFVLILSGLLLVVLALGRPQWGEMTTENKGRGRDVIIIVDVSRSMLATDLPPNRLQRAKLAAEDLVRQLPGDRIGLVAFAGSAFLQAPVTADHNAVLTAIHELDPEIIPMPGTNLSGALQCADDAFDRSEGGQRAIVLITDGEELEADAVTLAKEMSAKMRIFTVGVGSVEGAVLMVPSSRGGMEYVRDASGNVVQSKLDEGRLLQIAEAGSGFYTHLVSGPAEMRRIAQAGISTMQEHDVLLQTQTRAIDQYQWPLGIALLVLAVGFCLGERPVRRQLSAWVLGLFLVLQSDRAFAATSLGRSLYETGNYARAQEAFGEELKEDPGSPQRAFNLGAAAYKNGKWAEAIDAFGKALATRDEGLRSRAEYNLANTLVQQARQGRRGQDGETLEQAVSHYDEAIRRDPSFEDAKANREFVKRLLEKKQEQQQKKGDNQKDQKNKDEKDQNKGQESQPNEGGDSKDGEQQPEGESGEEGKQGKQTKKDGKESSGDPKNDKQNQQTAQNGQNGQQPEPVEEQLGDPKERGELKDSPLVDQPDKGDGKDKAEKEAQMAKAEGKMTRDQAKALMDALRSEDRRVQVWTPNKPEGQAGAKTGKTW